MRIVLCRHGETDSNVVKRFQGTRETELNDNGLKQAKLISEHVKDIEFFKAFSSPRKRALQTAKEILNGRLIDLSVDDRLGEINYGIFEGLTIGEVNEKFPGKWSERIDDKYEFPHEGGESYREADENRVKPFLEDLKEKYYSRDVLVVTHQGIGRLLLGNTLGLTPNEKMEIDFPNKIIYFIEFRPHKTDVTFYDVKTQKTGNGYLKKNVK